MNQHQHFFLHILAVVAIVAMAIFWWSDRQRTDKRVAKQLRAEIEAVVQDENTYTLDYAKALFTNQLFLDVEDHESQAFPEIRDEQLFSNVFLMWNLRKTRHWKRTNFDAERVMAESLYLLKIDNAEEFESRFKNSEVFAKHIKLFEEPNSTHLSEMRKTVRAALKSSGYIRNPEPLP